MKNKKSGTLFIWVFAAAALFLAVPFIFQENTSKNGNALSIDGEGVLPVESSDNPLARYFNRFAEFYGLKKKGNKNSNRKSFDITGVGSQDEAALAASLGDAMSSIFGAPKANKNGTGGGDADSPDAEAIEAIRASYVNKTPAVSLEGGTVQTRGGMVLKPVKDGYYLGDKFYKNGTYPSIKDRKEIENALSKFHKAAAASNGLRAAYVRNQDGSLSVKYVEPEYLDNKSRSLFASARGDDNYYDGARILSRTESGPSSAINRSSSSSGRKNISNSMDDIDIVYNGFSERLNEHFKNTGDKETNNAKGPNNNNLSSELIVKSNTVEPVFLASSKASSNANAIPDKYDGAPSIALKWGNMRVGEDTLTDMLDNYGLHHPLDFTEISIPEPTRRGDINKIKEDIAAKVQSIKKDGLLKVFSPSTIPDYFVETNKDPNLYIAYPRVPYVNIDRKGQPKIENFSEVFLDRTGVENMFAALGVPNDELAQLRESYVALDEKRNENSKYLQLIGRNKDISNKMPKVVFYLGKFKYDKGKVAVASPSSFLYVYAPNMAPDFVAGGDSSKAYQPMLPEVFMSNVNAKGSNNIVIVNNEEVRDTLIKSGVRNVAVIDSKTLSAGTPKQIEEVIDSLKNVVTDRILSDQALKQEFMKALSASDKKEKARK